MSFQVVITILVAIGSLAYFIPTPQELREAFVAGQNYFAARNYTKAIEQYDKVLATDSDFLSADSVRVVLLSGDLNVGVRTAALYQKANSFRTLGMLDSAIATFRRVLERYDSPKLLVLSRYQIYDLFLQQKEYDSAITAARELIREHPFDEKVEQALYDIGWAFRFKLQYDSSSITFRYLADKYKESPYRVRALYQIGQNALDAQHWREAVHAFSYLLSEYKPESFSRTDFQNMELRVNRERQIFEAVSNRESDNTNLELASKAEFKIAEAYEHLNNIDSAVARYQYIIRTYTLLPSLIEISYIRWAELMVRVRGIEQAVQVYRRAIDEHFQNNVFQARMQYKIARTYQDQKEFKRAAEEYLFYVKAYAEVADAAEFSLENARFFAVLNFSAAKEHEQVIAATDSFLTHHSESEFTPKALIMRGNSFLALKKFTEARQCYEQVVNEYGASEEGIHAHMQTARSYYDEKNYEEAIVKYTTLEHTVQGDKERNEVRYYLGMSYFFMSKLNEAVLLLKQVEPTSQFYPFAFARAVKIYSSLSQTDSAEKYITAIIAQLSDSSEFKPYAHLSYGELLATTGKFEKAIEEMSIVIRDTNVVENARLQARYARGALYQQTKKFKEAIADLEYCLEREQFKQHFAGTIPAANEKLALSYLGVGKRKEAVEKIITLLNQATTNVDKVKYLSALTEIYVQLNDFTKVVEYGRQVVSADSADENSRAKAYAALANAYGNMNNFDNVVAVLRQAADALSHHPYVKEILWQTAMLMYDGQAFAYATPLFETYIEKYPDDQNAETALYYRGVSLFGSGNVDEAITAKRKYLQKYPKSERVPMVQYEIAEIYYNTERYDMAAQEYDRTTKLFPSSEYAATAQYNKGWCYFRLGDTLKMVESFERFVQLYPNSSQAPDAQFSIGDYYYNIKNYEKAKVAYQVILDKYPTYSRFEEAKGLVRELKQINSYLEYSKAIAVFDAQDYPRAIAMLEEVIKKYPDADVRYACEANIASAYSELGQKQKAYGMFKGIIEKYSGIPEAQMVVFFAEQHKRWLESKINQ